MIPREAGRRSKPCWKPGARSSEVARPSDNSVPRYTMDDLRFSFCFMIDAQMFHDGSKEFLYGLMT